MLISDLVYKVTIKEISKINRKNLKFVTYN